MFQKIKSFLENIDGHRDRFLFPFIKNCWPKFISPNQLTILRIILSADIVYLLFIGFESRFWLTFIFVFGALLDLLDGSIARGLNKITVFGTVWDPIADRLLVLPVAIYILAPNYLWLLIALLAPELYSAVLSTYKKVKGFATKPNIFGKTKMVIECVAFAIIIVFNFPNTPSLLPIMLLYIAFGFLIIDCILKSVILKKDVKTIQHP